MKRVIVLGCSGSGKSTLARAMGERLGLPVHHLDSLFWTPGWKERPREEFRALHDAVVAQDAWILDGNYTNVIETRLPRADHVVFLDFRTATCLRAILQRRFSRAPRPDMAEGCPEQLEPGFLWYVLTWNRIRRRRTQRLLAAHPELPVTRLRNRREVADFLAGL